MEYQESHTGYALYYIEELSNELKQEIRSRLVSVCHGAIGRSLPVLKSILYKATVKGIYPAIQNKSR